MDGSPPRKLKTLPVSLWRRFRVLVYFIAALWATHLANILLGGALTRALGLVPRRVDGLDGILAMPFLHGSWEHLWANTTPLLLLGGLILALAPERFLKATLISVLVGGALTWLFARDNNHIGASGLIFGWFGFLVALGLLERSRRALLGAFIAIAFYGVSTVLGLDPSEPRVSWEGHLAGLVAGAAAAWFLRKPPTPPSK